jgi:hypothetical protein
MAKRERGKWEVRCRVGEGGEGRNHCDDPQDFSSWF